MVIKEFERKYLDEIIKMIDDIYHEYHDRIFLEGFDADLLDIYENYTRVGGKFWIALDSEERIAGSVAVQLLSTEQNTVELKRMYVKQEYRGKGLSEMLLQKVFDFVYQKGYNKIILWSDVRFKRAHAFYKKYGFEYTNMKHMNNGAMPFSEFCFELIT